MRHLHQSNQTSYLKLKSNEETVAQLMIRHNVYDVPLFIPKQTSAHPLTVQHKQLSKS